MREIRLQAADGAGGFAAFVAEPPEDSVPAGSVVLIQEIFGVNDALRAAAEEIAAMGFIVVCPDLFWRLEPGVNLTDKTKEEWDKAFKLMNDFDQDKGVEDLMVTLTASRKLEGANGKAGVLGYCLGGRLAVMMAIRSDADVNVAYYGVHLEKLAPEFSKIMAPTLIHMAEKDEFASAKIMAEVEAAAKSNDWVRTERYPAVQHAFARINGVHYDARAATIANGRSIEALARVLG